MLRGSYEGKTEKVTTWFKQEDDLVIPEGILSGAPVDEYVTAIVKTTLFSISINHLQKIIATIPEMSELMLLLLEEKYNEGQNRERLLRLPTAKDRYNFIAANQDFILKRAPHYLIASYLNVTKETFSRLHKGLSY
jgi:CRP-like cAMP-binding protein